MPIATFFFDQTRDPAKLRKQFMATQKKEEASASKEHRMANNYDPIFQNKLIREIMGDYANRIGNCFYFFGGRNHINVVRELLKNKSKQWTIDVFIAHLTQNISKEKLNAEGCLVKRLMFIARACNPIGSLGIETDPQKFVSETWDTFANQKLTAPPLVKP